MAVLTARLSERLEKARFRVHTGRQLGVASVQFVASKTIFIFAGLALLSAHIVVLEKDEVSSHDIDDLFIRGFELAKRINRIPLLRGMQFGYAVLPLVIGRNPDPESLLYAASPPVMPRLALFKFPIVVDLTRCQVAFFEGYEKFGSGIWPSLQRIVTKHIEPVVDEGCS